MALKNPSIIVDFPQEVRSPGPWVRFGAKREHLKRSKGLLPESQGQNRALIVLYVPDSLDRSRAQEARNQKPRGLISEKALINCV